jgi:hypothetical protein
MLSGKVVYSDKAVLPDKTVKSGFTPTIALSI